MTDPSPHKYKEVPLELLTKENQTRCLVLRNLFWVTLNGNPCRWEDVDRSYPQAAASKQSILHRVARLQEQYPAENWGIAFLRYAAIRLFPPYQE